MQIVKLAAKQLWGHYSTGKPEWVVISKRRDIFCIIFLLPGGSEGKGRPEGRLQRRIGPVFFGTLPKKREEKSYKSKKHTKNGTKRGYFNIFVNFLQYFDHFTVEIFSALDYNKARKSKEGPKC